MKTLLKLPLLAAGLLAAAASPFIYATVTTSDPAPAPAAATPAAATPAAAPDFAAKHPRLHALMLRRQALRQRVARRLNLTADQISQLKAERARTATAVKGIRADTALTPEQKKAKIRETLQSARTTMRGVLTPDQQTQLKEMRSRLLRWRGRQ